MNIEINKIYINDIEKNFKLNDSILRFIILKKENIILNSSIMNKKINKLSLNLLNK